MPTTELPLAIKYRPRKLSQVVGQDHVVESIRNFLAKGRIPNTILISGPYGSGKTTLARLLCLYLNCENPKDSKEGVEPCLKCQSCKSMKLALLGRGDHPDLVEIDAATKRGIADMKGLQSIAELAPTYNYRLIVLDECQEITHQGWRSNLKILEHPPGSTKYVLPTTNPEKLPETIVSRSFRLALQKCSTSSLSALLNRVAKKEGYALKKRTRLRIVDLSGNHPRDALQLLENVLNYMEAKKVEPSAIEKHFPKIFDQSAVYKTYRAVQHWWTAIWAGDAVGAFKALDSADNYTSFLDQAILIFRNIVRAWMSKSLVDRSKMWALRETKFPGSKVTKKTIDPIAQILDRLTTAQSRVKSFEVDAIAIIEQTTLELLDLTTAWR